MHEVRKAADHQNKLLIVGNDGGTNIGGSFLRGALQLGLDAHLISMQAAMDAPAWLRRFNWRVRGRRPTWLKRFSKRVVEEIRESRPAWLLATGLAPLTREALKEIGSLGVRRLNFLTDDPWNPAHRASWFFKALPEYDCVFSPRRSNLNDLSEIGCQQVHYVPFGYDKELLHPEAISGVEERNHFRSEVVFAGGADADRVSYFVALSRAGIGVSLYGDYWERWEELRKFARGYADPLTLRKAIGSSKVSICLVRRANRDGHSMRSFEVPAVGACMLVEDTAEHREIFGEDLRAVVYFSGIEEMLRKVRWLLEHEEERKRLAQTAHQLIIQGHNTYRDRLMSMLTFSGAV